MGAGNDGNVQKGEDENGKVEAGLSLVSSILAWLVELPIRGCMYVCLRVQDATNNRYTKTLVILYAWTCLLYTSDAADE